MNPVTNNQSSISNRVVPPAFSRWIKGIAQGISIVVHPLFIPLIGAWLIVHMHYFQFAGFHKKEFIQLYGSIIANAIVLPAFTVFLLKKLKFISSIQMHKRADRVIPYIAIMTFYFWTYMVFNNQDMMPDLLKAFLLGNFIAAILGFVSNLRMKVSMHMMGLGGLIGLLFCFLGNPYVHIILPLTIVLFASGLIASCRLILGEHSYRELYMGAAFGIFAQLLAFWIV